MSRRRNPHGGGLFLLGLLALAGGGYYWYTHRAVTQLQPGNKYQLSGGIAQIAAAAAMPGWQGVQASYNQDGTGVMTGTYSGPASGVPLGLMAHAA